MMVLILAIVVSLDGLTAAVAYGARNIRLTPLAVGLVSLASAVILWLAMRMGQLLSQFLPAGLTTNLGALLWLVMGCYLLYEQSRPSAGARMVKTKPDLGSRPVAVLKLRALGIVVQILRDPVTADIDQSGIITWQESWLLGLALSLDSFGVGIGAAMTGLEPNTTALATGLVTLFSLLIGWELGYRLQHKVGNKLARMPGFILIFLGVVNLFIGL